MIEVGDPARCAPVERLRPDVADAALRRHVLDGFAIRCPPDRLSKERRTADSNVKRHREPSDWGAIDGRSNRDGEPGLAVRLEIPAAERRSVRRHRLRKDERFGEFLSPSAVNRSLSDFEPGVERLEQDALAVRRAEWPPVCRAVGQTHEAIARKAHSPD